MMNLNWLNSSFSVLGFIKRSLYLATILMLFSGCRKEIVSDGFSKAALQYKPYGLTHVWDAYYTEKGEVLILGLKQKEVKLLKTTTDGTLIWQKDIDLDEKQFGENNSVVSQSDGTILIFGTQAVHALAEEIKIIRMNASGEVIKSSSFSIQKNSPGFFYPIYSTSYDGIYAPDKNGGYFLQLTFFTRLSYQVGFETFIAHCDEQDSIDAFINFNDKLKKFIELTPGKNGNLNVLVSEPDTAVVSLQQFNRAAFINKTLVPQFDSELKLGGGADLVSVSDENHLYNFQVIPDQKAEFTESVFVTKTELISGNTIDQWHIPLKVKISSQSRPLPIRPAVGLNGVYFSFNAENDAIIVKTTKDGKETWTQMLNGNESRERTLKLLPKGDELMVFGLGSKNRSKESNLWMINLDRNGKFISK